MWLSTLPEVLLPWEQPWQEPKIETKEEVETVVDDVVDKAEVTTIEPKEGEEVIAKVADAAEAAVADKVAEPLTESKEGEGIVEVIPEKIDTVEEVTDKVQEGIGFYSNPLLPWFEFSFNSFNHWCLFEN